MGRLERSAKAEAPRKIPRKQEHKMPETTVPVSLRDAFLEDPFFRTGWDEMNSECKEMRSFTSKEGDNSLSMDRGWPWLPKQWMLPQLLKDSDFHLPEMKDSLLMGLQEEEERLSTPIQVDHVRSSSERKTSTEEASAKQKREDILNQGRVDNFDGPGEMQRRRRSLLKAGRSRDTSGARETSTTTADTAKENRESKTTSARGSSRGREMVVERREERIERGRSRGRDVQVPMTLRQPFLDDPFFKGTLAKLENTREDFFKQARESFEESIKQMESRMSNALTLSPDSFFPKDWIMNPPSSLSENFGSMLDRKRDCSTIKHKEDDNKVEVHLDTSGYKPDELKVQVEGGIVRVEGKHEEKSEAGAVMVSRQFVKEYALPESGKPEGVESSLSKDGVLVITMPKPRKAINQDKSRSVPIAIK